MGAASHLQFSILEEDMTEESSSYYYEHLTWPEMRMR